MRQCDQEKNLKNCTCAYESCSKKAFAVNA